MMRKKFLVAFVLVFAALGVLAKPALAAVSFSLSPASGTYTVGDQFVLNVVMDTGGDAVDSVSVRGSFPIANLEAVGQLTSDTFTLELVNTLDNTTGTIRFDAGSHTDQNGSNIVVAKMTFKAKAVGTATVTISDSSQAVEAASNTYLVTTGGSGQYTLQSAAGGNGDATPTPSPSPAGGTTPTPTLAGGGATPTPTPQEVPVTGFDLPTISLVGAGVMLLLLGVASLFLF